jgi:excinuclease ABC subunit A
LHLADVSRLVEVLQDLVDRGNTVAVIEHNLDFIAASDYIIDLGPEGGDQGGTIVAAGPPQALLRRTRQSHTAKALKHHLRAAPRPVAN